MSTWIIVGTLAVGAPALKDERKPVKPPGGEWVLVRQEFEGHSTDFSRQELKSTATFSPTGWALTTPGDSESFVWKAAWFKAGGQLEADFWQSDPKNGPKSDLRRAIWKVEGNTLAICGGRYHGPRPTGYSAPEGSFRFLWVFTRKGD